MKKIPFKSLFQSEIVRNSSILLSGNALGQAIAFLVYPLLTRLYSDADFGVFSTFTSVCSLLTTIGTGRYEESLVIASDKKNTSLLLGFSLKWLTFFSLMLFAILIPFRKPVLAWFNLDDIAIFWYYIPLTVFICGLAFLLNNLATREKQFKMSAYANVVRNGVSASSRLLSGLLSFTKMGLIFSNLIALIASVIPYASLNQFVKSAIKGRWQEEKKVAWQFKEFPVYNLSRNLISSFSMNLPFLYLIGIFDAGKLGLFSLAFLVLNTPIGLVVSSLFSTFFENFTTYKREKKSILPTLKTYWKNLCLFILPFFIIAFFIAKPLFSFVFGEQWEEAGLYFQCLLPWMFMMLATAPLYSVFIVFKKQHKTVWIEAFYLILRWAALFTGVHFMDFHLGILLFSLVGFLFTSTFLVWIHSIIRKYEKDITAIP